MSFLVLEKMDEALNKRNVKLRSVYPGFKCVAEKLKDAKILPEFWKKESENIRKANAKARKEKESMKMSFEKFHQEFTI